MNIKCMFSSYKLLSETDIIPIIQRDIIVNVHTSSSKVHVILVRF